MNTIKRVKNDNYTTISNVFLKDSKLSLKSKGFLTMVMSLPNDWDFSVNGMCSITKEGKTSIYNVISELKDKGYCKYTKIRNDKGVILGNDYTFYEESIIETSIGVNPYTDNPNVDIPYIDNHTQLNKDINIIKNNKEKEYKEKKDSNVNDEVEELYKLYPSKCPKRNISLGKCFKDKERLKKLLKTHSYEMLKFTIEQEISEKYNKSYMANFSTFLNNLPDYGFDEKQKNKDGDKTEVVNESIEIDGVTYK